MWSVEHSIATGASPEVVWQLWADVSGWPDWNGGIERIELEGPFETGSRVLMTTSDGDRVELELVEAYAPESFVDEARFGELVIRTTHRVDALDDGRSLITYRMEIEGEGGDEVGPQISGDFPQVLAALADRAELHSGAEGSS